MAERTSGPPRDLGPMFAVAATEVPHDDDRWSFEMKWDGMRTIAVVDDGRVTLTTRQGNDATARFPELGALGPTLAPVDVVLDGEIVALDQLGRPSFEALQPRMHVASAASALVFAAERPVVCMFFDVLWVEGHTTLSLPYHERRALLEALHLDGPAWQTPPATVGRGEAVLATATELGLEGIVAKRLDSTYQAGRRSDAWRKIKPTASQDLVVGGWLPGNGRLDGRLGSVLVGYHDPPGGALRYAGRVGSGLDESKRSLLERRVQALARATSPFEHTPKLPSPHWVEPVLVVEVGFHQWTGAGMLRAPRYRGLRNDKTASDVVREHP